MIKLALLAIGLFALQAAASVAGAPGEYPNLWCYVGTLTTTKYGVYMDNRTSAQCGSYEECFLYNFTGQHNGTEFFSQTGLCIYNDLNSTIDYCEAARNYSPEVRFDNCTYAFCQQPLCNEFVEPKGCPEEPVDDIKLLPNCTMRETLHEMENCFAPFALGFPYHDRSMCRSNVDEVVQCVARMAQKCLSGSCFTVLDFIPYLRYYQRVAKHVSYSVHSLEDLFSQIESLIGAQIIPRETVDFIIDTFVCPVPGVIPEFLQFNIDDVIPILPNPICDENIARDAVRAGIDFARSFYSATSQQELCVAATAFFNRIQTMLNGRCDLTKVPELIDTFLTGAYSRLQPVIMKALHILVEYVSNFQLPDCGVAPPVEFNCEQYYYSDSKCDQRKAWFCDYARWRIQSVTSFVQSLYEWADQNMLDVPFTPPTCQPQAHDLCMDASMRRCFTNPIDPNQCPFCYCQNFQYRRPQAVLKQYRYDIDTYRNLAYAYKHITEATGTGGGCGGD